MARRKRLGDYLIEAGVITDEQLQQALIAQRNSGLKLPGSTVSRCTNRHKPRRVKGCGGCG